LTCERSVIRLITACSIPHKQFVDQKMPLEEHQIDKEQKMIDSVKINKAIEFTDALKIGSINLEEVVFERKDNEWISFKMILKIDYETNRILEQHAFFNNQIENRLEEVEGGFNTSLLVFMELLLDSDNFHLLPESSADFVDYFENLSASTGLLQENIWNLLIAWQEHRLDPSIGGGVLKVGYQTVFTEPKNKIDALKRQGIVSKAIVTALVENQFPVHFKEKIQGFETKLMLGGEVYTAVLKPNDKEVALTLILLDKESKIEAFNRESVIKLIEEINKEITIGEFLLTEENHLSYFHYMNVSPELVSPQWVTEMLLAGLSLIHHYHALDPLLININKKK